MPSQEDYLDELLRSLENGEDGQEQLGEDVFNLSSGGPEPSAETSFGDLDALSGADPQPLDVSSMSEDEIERLLAESSGVPEDGADSPTQEFSGDVVELLEGTQDSELKEIQDLLEKSDKNEAVAEEITDLLKGDIPKQDAVHEEGPKPKKKKGFFSRILKSAAKEDEAVGEEIAALLQEEGQGRPDSPNQGSGADGTGEAGGNMTPKQQKALEKKRLKEEKAAAKKAAKEAKKAAKKAGKTNQDGTQNADGMPDTAASGGAEGTEAIDTAFLDSILSEAGKIDGTETVSSATGNYDAKVDNILPEDGGKSSTKKSGAAAGAGSSGDSDLGIDFDNLFGNSSAAEDAMLAGGGDSDFSDFVALDGSDVTGILELTGEGEDGEKPKKKGFFSRFLEFLTEEDEEEENEDIKLSEENQEILEDLDKEKKGKKGKKSKKKAKKADASAENGDDDEEGGDEKKGKKKKQKKPKKEKPPKEEEPVDPRKRLSLKKVLPVLLICLSLGLAIIIMTFASVEFSDKRAAKDAYYQGDYQTCYQNLFGKDLNESEQVMYGKSESILYIRLWIREYEMLAAEGKELNALDCLIQSVNDYPKLYEYASQWNATEEIAQEYAVILNLLSGKYGLTEEQARAIAAEPDDIEYTKQVNAIVQGGAYGSWNEPEQTEEVPLPDVLPEEDELPEGNFIDTNAPVQ